MSEKHKKKSKLLSYVLRHKPEEFGIELKPGGWVDVITLLDAIERKRNIIITFTELQEIVSTDAKGRYSFSLEAPLRIRANQGHSTDVEMNFESKQPPDELYHGTSIENVGSIGRLGIQKMNRQFVHLSADKKTAVEVGARHGDPFVFHVQADEMFDDGFTFYQSENGVWLVDHVPVKYL